MVISLARKSCTVVKESLNRKAADTTHNIINFINSLSKEELKTMGIKDMIAVITWEKNSIGKHHHIESFQEKEN